MFPIGDDNSYRKTIPYVTYSLIVFNIIVFIVELVKGDPFIERFSFFPSNFLADPLHQYGTIFTAMFLHAGWVHLGGNMLYLWVFGDNVEDRFGHLQYLIFYLVCGAVAIFSQLAFSLGSSIIGASGAIAGILGAYMLLFPQRRVNVLLGYKSVRMPALIVIGLWFMLQFFSGVGTLGATPEGGTAFMAHIGGFIAGFVLAFELRGNKVA